MGGLGEVDCDSLLRSVICHIAVVEMVYSVGLRSRDIEASTI